MNELLNAVCSRVWTIAENRLVYFGLPFFLIFLSLLSAFPSYDILNTTEMSSNWNAILMQTDEPFVSREYQSGSHEANLAFRLTPVVIGGFLGIKTVTGYIILQLVSLLLLFGSIVMLFNKLLGRGAPSVLLSASMAFVFIGNVLCSDYRGFFDVLSFLFLTISMLSNKPLIIFLSSMLGFYTDERALIASSLILVFYLIEREYETNRKASIRDVFHLNKKMVALVGSWAVYFASRQFLSVFFDLKTNSEGMISYLLLHASDHVNMLPFGIWTGLEGFWVIVVFAVLSLIRKESWISLFLFLGSQTIVIFVALWTFDITRSMAYLLPSVFISALILMRSASGNMMRYVTLGTFVICIFPTYYAGGPNTITWFYPLPLQLIRMFFS